MKVLNIHERTLTASADDAGGLINNLASAQDRLWPGKVWPPMRFDRSLGVGASGGHKPIGYYVEEFAPGRRIRFRFTAPRGFDGYHCFEVLPKNHGVILRHTISMKAKGLAHVYWLLVIAPLHDALLEDALALAQIAVGEAPAIRPWSPWVKFLRWILSRGKARPQHLAFNLPA